MRNNNGYNEAVAGIIGIFMVIALAGMTFSVGYFVLSIIYHNYII